MKRVCIIGSGITALARAWQLKQAGHTVEILEASDSIGGAIQSIRQGPYLAEEGPNSIQVNSLEVDRFLKSIPGIEDRILPASNSAKKRFILRNGQPTAVPMGPLSAIKTPLWSLPGKLRVLKEPFIAAPPAGTEESAASFVRRRLGDELYNYTINPLIGGIYAGNPEALSLRYAFPKLYALEQAHGSLIRGGIAKMRAARKAGPPEFEKRIISFKDGLHELPQLLAGALKESIHTKTKVEAINQTGNAWSVAFNGSAHSFDEVVTTLPAHTLETLPLPEEIKAEIQALPKVDYPPVSVLSLAFKKSEITHPLDGFGVLVPECEDRSILGVLFPSTLFQNRAPEDEALLTVFVGGERQPELASPDIEELKTSVIPELTEILGINGSPSFAHLRHWPKAIPQYKIGHGDLLQKIDSIEATYPGLQLRGNFRDGISLSYCIEASLK